jgi:hypothetical protein
MGIMEWWWPVTYEFGLIRSDLDTVATTMINLYAGGEVIPIATWLSGSLEECFSVLEPLSIPPRKELYLATNFGWTLFLQSSTRGSDAFMPMFQLSRALGVTALRACVTPAKSRYPGVILEVYDTPEAGGGKCLTRRSIAAVNDGGRWVFEHYGTPFAFEDLARYEERRKRDRFTGEMLFSYLEKLGIPAITDDTLLQGGACRAKLLALPELDGFAKYTLAEAKVMDR